MLQREQAIERRDLALLAKETTLEEKAEALAKRLKELDHKEKAKVYDQVKSVIEGSMKNQKRGSNEPVR